MRMHSYGFHVLRVGMGITFAWVGVLILQDPAAWTGFIKPWAADLLWTTPERAMIGTGIFDLIVGFFLLIDFWTFWFSILATIHLAIVLLVSGIDAITVRDIGLLTGVLALVMDLWPQKNPPNK